MSAEKPENPARRAALKGLAALAVGSVVAKGYFDKGDRLHRPREEAYVPLPEHEGGWELAPEEFEVGELGYKQNGGREIVGNFYGEYIGYEGKGEFPETLSIDYSAVLKSLWDTKIAVWSEKLKPGGKTLNKDVITEESREKMYADRWNDRAHFPSRAEALGRTSLPQFITDTDVRIGKMQEAFSPSRDSLGKLQEVYKASGEQMTVVRELFDQITAKDLLVAYSMTELLPRDDGYFNAKFYDFLLRTGGKEFIANIPSGGDAILSFGPFQFTKYALNDTENEDARGRTHHTIVGASKVNQALPKELQIPKELEDLADIEDHFAAAYMFAINNLFYAAGRLHGHTLTRFSELDHETLIEFIATSHNNPTLAFNALRKYLIQQPARHHQELPFQDFLDGKLPSYASKTRKNFEGLNEYLAEHQ